ncbi:MAG: N-acetyl-gamma-glutamyl-phosphate reductase [Abditibacteriota bacterium]|nr:N-acetyl-gamma-glutamyl-phosphate reductase [Abditibacteriota bacterium]
MIRVGIIGAAGYAGAELIRYLSIHPQAEITFLGSDSSEGKPISEAYPSFLGLRLPLCEKYSIDRVRERCDFVFTARGNGGAMAIAREILESGIKMIDIPADFRLKDTEEFQKFYKLTHTEPELLKEAVYAVPELRREDIRKARLAANPGCYATCSILSLAPLVAGGYVDLKSIIIDAKSGVSGAGRSKLSVPGLFAETNEGFKAYGVTTHRHTPEIEQEFDRLSGGKSVISFTPHLVPMNRGIQATCYASYAKGCPTGEELRRIYSDFYADEPFVKVLPQGMQPVSKWVSGTNYCFIGVESDVRCGRCIISGVIDNMGKGAAGQAVQNFNLMNGLEETAGLTMPAVFP